VFLLATSGDVKSVNQCQHATLKFIYEFLMLVITKIMVLWDVTPCRCVDRY